MALFLRAEAEAVNSDLRGATCCYMSMIVHYLLKRC